MTHLRRKLLTPYHYLWAALAALWHGFPAKKMVVIGVTGTKGKSSVAEMLYSIFTAAGHKTAIAGTIRFAIGTNSRPNLFKMTLPGRGFIQKFLAEARAEKCTYAIVEITSEAALQYRHLGLNLDTLVFTNLQKEHLESHGSMEKYFCAKFAIGESLIRSPKRPRAIIANADDIYGSAFLALPVEKCISFSFSDAKNARVTDQNVSFEYGNVSFDMPQPGNFSVMNALSSIKTAEAFGVPLLTCADALHELLRIGGRVEKIDAGQNFLAIVDYAHTPDSLRALYDAFGNRKLICVLGNTGGGRDAWKRPEMGRIADEHCEKVILTNEDPYDEDPRKIVDEMAHGMARAPEIIMDRRKAIRAALRLASLAQDKHNIAVLITGKGTDPFIMGPCGTKTLWNDASVVREELKQLIAEV
ncbi:MAG: UDP-N-acetylmuramyl-tripeptide synthetase [Candidatus Kaiserbacteria bacterium]|nr:UDP-N-acetylmuramyl-tripeptide synthetase [Candidatus Kaiserbacteria bacterium]